MALSPERWREASQRFEALVEALPSEREAALAELRQRDPELAGLVGRLLAEDEAEAGPLDEGIRGLAPTVVSALDGERLDAAIESGGLPEIAGIEIGERLGQGGMGEVFRAERTTGDVRQTVALKLLRPGMDSIELRRRFQRERRILAELDHPDIARFVDAGVARDGRPWLAMEYVDGEPITDHARRAGLDLRQRVGLVLRVARAVAFAQSRLVVHRDLKPSNILIDREGRPRLLDFGIAKLIEAPDQLEATQTSLRALSPAYAAPEQIVDGAISTATDVYALGLVLYELLTGRLPSARRASSLQALAERMVRETTQRPSAVLRREMAEAESALALDRGALERQARATSGDLDLIVLTALQNEPARRYASAQAFAADLQAWLEGRPIAARPDSAGYRLRRFVARHRLGVAASVLALTLLLGALAAALWQADRATRAEVLAQAEAAKAMESAQRSIRTLAFFTRLLSQAKPTNQGKDLTVAELIRTAATRVETELAGYPNELADVAAMLADHLTEQGDAGLAIDLADLAVRNARSVDSISPNWFVAVLQTRSHAASALGRGEEAERDMREAIALLTGDDEQQRLQRIRMQTSLSTALGHQGRYEEVLEVNLQTLRDREQLLGDAESPALAVDWNNLGSAYSRLERYGEAEQAYRRALALFDADPEAPPPRRIWVLNGIASARVWTDPDTAHESLLEAVESAGRLLPPNHSIHIGLSSLQARLEEFSGQPDLALQRLDGLAQSRESNDPVLPLLLMQRGEVLLRQQRTPDAIADMERALALLTQRGMEPVPLAARVRSYLALATARIDQSARILEESAAALQALRDAPIRYPRSLAEAKLNHAEVLWRTGREADARALRAEAESAIAELWPDGHPHAANLLSERLPSG